MLIQFSVANFKTFKDKATISLLASNYDKETREVENILQIPDFSLRILKSAVMYCANASGKSRFMEAMVFMKNFVIRSSMDRLKGDPINVDPFRLADSENNPTEFEILFLHNNEMYRYGFMVRDLLPGKPAIRIPCQEICERIYACKTGPHQGKCAFTFSSCSIQ